MRYLRVVEEQGRYVASLPEMAQPTPARGEVLIRVTASGVNRADLSQIAGRYPPPPGESEILGLEVSGTLVDTGEPVCALLAGGGHAEYESTRLNSSHTVISYAVFCLKKKNHECMKN